MTNRRDRAEEALKRLQGAAGDLLATVATMRAARKGGKGKESATPPGAPREGSVKASPVVPAGPSPAVFPQAPSPAPYSFVPAIGLPDHSDVESAERSVENVLPIAIVSEQVLESREEGVLEASPLETAFPDSPSTPATDRDSTTNAQAPSVGAPEPFASEPVREFPVSDPSDVLHASASELDHVFSGGSEETVVDDIDNRQLPHSAAPEAVEERSTGAVPAFESLDDVPQAPPSEILPSEESRPSVAEADPGGVPAPSLEAEEWGSEREQESEDLSDEALEAEPDTPWANLPDDQRRDLLSEIEDLLAGVSAALDHHPFPSPGTPDWQEMTRKVHTLKGTANLAGAKRAGWWLHLMEASMEDWGRADADEHADPVRAAALQDNLLRRFATAQTRLSQALMPPVAVVAHRPQVAGSPAPEVALPPGGVIQADRVKIEAGQIDRLITEANEACLSGGDIATRSLAMRSQLRNADDGIERIGRLVRDLEVQAEAQIEYRRSELQSVAADFDPLELDRYTRFQELARSISEAVTDIQDGHREMVRMVTEQDNAIAYQGRALQEVQSALHRTRLLPFETQQPRLQAALTAASADLGKDVTFELVGGMVELDRLLLERLMSPLEHILRNALAHGIEPVADRRAAGKPETGLVRVSLSQEPGRAHILVEDDGKGLDVARIRAKAIESNLWAADRPMDAREAADMVCLSKFSTASTVTHTAGRGVGMDVVRQEILRLGGTFEMRSDPGRGLTIAIQVPTTVATTSVIVASVGPERWAIPIGIIDDVVRIPFEQVAHARSESALEDLDATQGERIPYVPLADLMGVDMDPRESPAFVLILREGARRLAVEVDEVSRVVEAPLRSAGSVWTRVPGVVGAAILQDGSAAFVIDPLRAPDGTSRRTGETPRQIIRRPLVLVVDDSVTVRKAATQFLEKSGYDVATAKDGQEALEFLGAHRPAAMLLDVEMPRMDGFECARTVRDSSKNKDLPIIMITSRQAAKHRQRAESLGVNGYLSKPFHEEEVLALLRRYAPIQAPLRAPVPSGA